MARMIPPVFSDSTKSDGERQLFMQLRDDPETKDWTVLHSFDLANHRSQISGEIDFVIVVPELGVLCLEVKACHSLKIEEGSWRYGKSDKWDERGPFKQASEATHSLRTAVVAAAPSLRNVIFWSAVAFTHMDFEHRSDEWHRWQALDKSYLRTRGVGNAFAGVLQAARRHLVTKPTAAWFSPSSKTPTIDEARKLAAILRPNFESYESPRARVARVAAEAKKYTEEQYRALDYAQDNDRVVFIGPAGTGKTLLALEMARRASRSGRRTLFLCYNELLGNWLAEEARPLAPTVEFDRVARRMLKISGLTATTDSTFWEKTLPQAAVAAMIDGGHTGVEPYEELIVDEAQDFLRGSYIDFLDRSVIGGLKAGRVKLFGDFERQSVYEAADVTVAELKEGWMPDLATSRLRENCRNTPRVASLAEILGGLSPSYGSVRRPDDQVEPTIIEFHDDSEQQAKLLELLLELHEDGFESSNIVVLSVQPQDMCMSRIAPNSASSAGASGAKSGKSSVQSVSIRRFKGLEAPVIIITDILDADSDEMQKLLYVGVTRSLSKLFLLMHHAARSKYAARLQDKAQ
jgi:hypothetical protein